jgi:hypothetical protein
MDNRQRHEMSLEQNHPSGVQKWYCPICGQCLLVTWTPRYMTVIRKAGNKSALHTSGNCQQSGSGQPMSLDESRLTPWIAWMDAVSLENLWDNKVE